MYWTIQYKYRVYTQRAKTFAEACALLGLPWLDCKVISVSN